MDVKCVGDEIVFTGNLTETFAKEPFVALLGEVHSRTAKHVGLNLSNVGRANSCGVAFFLTSLEMAKVPIEFTKCPVWLVEQFNMIDEFFDNDVIVSSVYAPYFQSESGETTLQLIEISPDFLSSPAYKALDEKNDTAGKKIEADFDKEDYFQFLNSLKTK